MAIPERQLETWSNLGAEASAAKTYSAIKTALESDKSLVRDRKYEIYLQGSYRNKTNIYGDSDVDVVIELTSAFSYDIAALPEAQKAEFRRVHPGTAAYAFQQFRADVEKSLVQYFGSDMVKPRNKCIQVLKNGSRLDADVVPCQTFRLYRPDPAVKLPAPKEGIGFYTRNEGRLVVNYPKVHFDNGASKNASCNERYKPTVRIFKNLRNYLQAESKIKDGVAPSYFVECLLYNVSDTKFSRTSLQQRVAGILHWFHENLWTAAAERSFVCGNGIVPLFGPTPEQWSHMEAKTFIAACINAWNNW